MKDKKILGIAGLSREQISSNFMVDLNFLKKLRFKLKEAIIKNAPDAILLEPFPGIGMMAAKLAVELRIPLHVVVHQRGNFAKFLHEDRWLLDSLMEKASTIFVAEAGRMVTYEEWQKMPATKYNHKFKKLADQYLVDESTKILAVWGNGNKNQISKYAEGKKPISLIVPFWLASSRSFEDD